MMLCFDVRNAKARCGRGSALFVVQPFCGSDFVGMCATTTVKYNQISQRGIAISRARKHIRLKVHACALCRIRAAGARGGAFRKSLCPVDYIIMCNVY